MSAAPTLAGWEIYHLKGSPVDPNRLYASQSSGWFGQHDPALQRRRQDVGAGGQQVRLRRRPRHSPVVRRHAAPLGVQARLASRTVADRSGYRLRRGGRRRLVPLDRRRADVAGALRTARPRLRAPLAAGRRRDVPAHDPSGSERSRHGSSSPSRPRARSGPTTPARRGGRSTAD